MNTRNQLVRALILAGGGVAWAATQSPTGCALQPEHAAILVMQSPAAVRAKATGGCPAADYVDRNPGLASFQLRNLCAKSGDGVLGTYLVDLGSGQVWEDSAERTRVDSTELRSARTRVCAMSVKGVIPSMLPQGHTNRARTRRVATPSAAKKKKPVRKSSSLR